MFELPEPLHPAVVHFPIVLLLIGAGAAILSLFVHRWNLQWIAAILLSMAAISAFVAVETGEAARELVGKLEGDTETLMESHEEWAERTEIVAGVAAFLAVLAAVMDSMAVRFSPRQLGRFDFLFRPRLHGAVRALALLAALVSCFFVYETSRRGGALVYHRGVGVNGTSATGPADPGFKIE